MSRCDTAVQNYREINHGWIFCFLSGKTLSSTRFLIVCSHFSILYSRRNRESRIEPRIETRDGLSTDFWTVLYVSQHCWKTDWPTDWLTDCLIDWMNWMLTILLADRLTGLFKGRFIIYVEEATVQMAIIFLGRGARFFPEIFSIHFHKLPTT